jgi:hypothetical protein
MIGLVGVLRCGFGDQGGAHELDGGAAGGLVVEELAVVPVAAVPGGLGRHLTDHVRRHVGVGHRAQLPTGRPPPQVLGQVGVYVHAAFADHTSMAAAAMAARRSRDGSWKPVDIAI